MKRIAAIPQDKGGLPPILAAIATFIILLSYYTPRLAQGLTWANYGVDGGDLVTAAATLGVPHPPGYPTYVLLLHSFLSLPFGDLAAGAALFSAICTALACALFAALLARALVGGAWLGSTIALVASVTFGLAPLTWGQAVIAEVHGLNLFFVVLALWLLWITLDPKRSIGRLHMLLAAAMGLGLGNHLTLSIMVGLVMVAAGIRWRSAPGDRRSLLGMAAVGLAGAMVYLYLPISAQSNPPINWGSPKTIEGFLWTVSGKAYQDLAFSLPLQELPRRIAAWAGLLREGFGWAGIGLGIIGLIYGSSKLRRFDRAIPWMVGAYSAFALGYNTADSIEYLIPAHLGFAWWLGLGLNKVATWLREILPENQSRAAVVVPILAVTLLLLRAPSIGSDVDASNDVRAQEYGLGAMQSAPERAVILTWQALDAFPLWYYHHALGMRADLAVIVVPLMQFDWYPEHLRAIYPDLDIPDVRQLDLSSPDGLSPPDFWKRPVCFAELSTGKEPDLRLVCPEVQGFEPAESATAENP
jgi:hypothetical protein